LSHPPSRQLEGTSDVTISGNLLASVRPKALSVQTSRRVLFADNVLVDADSEHGKLEKSVLGPVLTGTGEAR
jgi:hypothetical protein